MKEFKKKIKNKYFKKRNFDLTDEELKKFVNDVWRRFLEDDDYLLVMPVSPLIDEEEIIERVNGYKIITKDSIKKIPAGEIGFICSIDWTSTDKLYMPDDLLKLKYIKTIPNIKAVYTVNNGEGCLSSSYNKATELAETLLIPLKSFNKFDYDDEYKMDYSILVSEIITSYIMLHYGSFDIELRDKLIKNYSKYIIRRYKDEQNSGIFNDKEFLVKITDDIRTLENIKIYNK